MALALIHSRASVGINAPEVLVETHISNGLPGFFIVGLPEKAVKESKDRVRSALLNTDYEFPVKRITVNLAPADLPKEGGRFDLPIAMGILAASEQIPSDELAAMEFVGELGLTGSLRSIKGALPLAMACKKDQRSLLLPYENAEEASLVQGVDVLAAKHIHDVCQHLKGFKRIIPYQSEQADAVQICLHDMEEVRGQPHARRSLEIAAAGGHSLLMLGPPGTGKTMLASRLPSILPPLSEDEAIQSAAIASITGLSFEASRWKIRKFRAPHHTASSAALVGGGSPPRPGEISLAHNGVLFLDELPEFSRQVLETLREPLESGIIAISRAARQAEFPARFQLIAAMNPCPCGYLTDPKVACKCSPEQIGRYLGRLSGPLLDRIDMHIEVPSLPKKILVKKAEVAEENSEKIRQRVMEARAIQLSRANKANAAMNTREIEEFCELQSPAQLFIELTMETLNLSARAYHRILKVARTIADLAGAKQIDTQHLTEALTYRRLERV